MSARRIFLKLTKETKYMNFNKNIQATNNKLSLIARFNPMFFFRQNSASKKIAESDAMAINDKRRHCIQDSKSFANESLSSEYCGLQDRINHIQSNKHTLI
jgi:hypothetical protein